MNSAETGSTDTGYASIHHLFHDRYIKGGSLAVEADQLERAARLMLERTTILPTLSRAKLLRTVVDRSMANLNMLDDAERENFFGIFRLLAECYEPIADDVLVISAFEIHAKASLLRSGYVIHDIASPRAIKKRQQESPVHVRTLRAAARRGEQLKFRRSTLGVDTLMKDRYIKHYPLPGKARAALQEGRRRRNFVHFAEPYVWSIEWDLLELIDHFSTNIPPIKVRRRRGGA